MQKRPAQTTYTLNQRAVKIHKIRQELKSLSKQYKEASEEQRPPLAELQAILRKRLMSRMAPKAPNGESQEMCFFYTSPFGLTKSLLGQKQVGNLVCSKEELDRHIQNTFSDPIRQTELGRCNILVEPLPPTKDFDTRKPLLMEVLEIVRKARSSLAPGPCGNSYKVYKYCSLLLKSHLEEREGGVAVEIC